MKLKRTLAILLALIMLFALAPTASAVGTVDTTNMIYSGFFQTLAKPAKPSAFKASSYAYNKIKLKWKAVSGAKGYYIYRSSSKSGAYKKIKTIKSGSTTSYTNSSLTCGKTYYYKIRAYNSTGNSSYSSVASAKPLPAKSTLTLTKKSDTSVNLSWKKVSGASGYKIYMKTGSGSYKTVKTLTSGKTLSYTKKSLKAGKTYTFRIRAYRTVSGKKVCGAYCKGIKLKL